MTEKPIMVQLPESKVVVDPTTIAFFMHADLNKYVIVIKSCPQGPIITGSDFDLLIEHMKGTGQLVRLEKKAELAKA